MLGIQRDRDLTAAVVKEYKAAAKNGDYANIDHAFIRDRFVWKNRQFAPTDADIEPLALWGTYDHEYHTQRLSRFCATTTSLFGTHWTYEQKLSRVVLFCVATSKRWRWRFLSRNKSLEPLGFSSSQSTCMRTGIWSVCVLYVCRHT